MYFAIKQFMYLYFEQIQELLQIIDKNQKIAGGDFDKNFITKDDKEIFLRWGIRVDQLVIKNKITVFNYLNFGMLADSLKQAEKLNYDYNQLKDYTKQGRYIPVSSRDNSIIESLKSQSYRELDDVDLIKIVREEMIEGARNSFPLQKIASNVGHKTKHWGLHELINYYYQIAWETAIAGEIKKRNYNKDPLVYKHVHKHGCCIICRELYLSNELGSEPKIFRLSELEINGINDLKNHNLWKPTVAPTHLNCDCSLTEKPIGMLWNTANQCFSTTDPEYAKQRAAKRPLIRVTIGNETRYI